MALDGAPALGHAGGVKRDTLIFYLNGQRQEISSGESGMMLADFLRYARSLTGTKIVCAEGDCGACSVLRYFPYGEKGFLPINACITTVAQMDGSSLVTVDALGGEELTAVQEAMVAHHGSQCGFCTPGFVVALTGLVEKKISSRGGPITEKEAKNALTGNLCRCTGYQPILNAATAIPISACAPLAKRFLTPAILRDLKNAVGQPLESADFVAPVSFSELKTKMKKSAGFRLLAAGTDLGVQHNKRKIRLQKAISLHLVKELYDCEIRNGKIWIGARVTFSQLRRKLVGSEFSKFLDLFASPQIKNSATLVGNVCNASPIADSPPYLLAMDGVAHLLGPKGKRSVPLAEFFLGYRQTALKAGECMVAIEIDLPGKKEKIGLYKTSQRKDLDISAVNAAFRFSLEKGKIRGARVAFGGVAEVPKRLIKVEEALEGSELGSALEERAVAILQKSINPLSDLRGTAAFRRVLAGNFLRQFLADCHKGKR